MSISYYTMDDAGRRKPPSAKQSVVEQFHNLSDALARYRELPETGEKTLGMVDGYPRTGIGSLCTAVSHRPGRRKHSLIGSAET